MRLRPGKGVFSIVTFVRFPTYFVFFVALVVFVLTACNRTILEPDSTHTTLHPTAPTSPTTPTTPTTPSLPSLTGTWAGSGVIVTSFVANPFNSCTVTLSVTAQASGQFFGFISFAGGTIAPCAQSGNVFGSIGSSGAVSLQFSLNGDPTSCATISDAAPLLGTAAVDGSLTLGSTVHRSCTMSTSAFSQDGVQSLSLSLRR